MPGQIHIPDGGSVSLGAKADAAVKTAASGSLIAHLRGLKELIIDKITANIQIGGVSPQLDDTDKVAVSLYGKYTAAGDLAVVVADGGQLIVTNANINRTHADATANASPTLSTIASTPVLQGVYPYLFNGTSWDRERGNLALTLLASAARTATVQSADQVNYNHRGFILFVDVSALADTPSITPYLQIKDSISSNYKTVWTAAAAITATGQYAYLFQRGGAAGSFTEAVNIGLSRTWRLGMTHADTDSITYSASMDMLV